MLNSRRQRDLEQKRRMARGKRNLSQLAGPVAQGQRTPMNRGSGSVSTVQAPPFRQSDPGDDITTAGLAYKGGKGLFDFTQGKEAYIDEAGNYIKATKPWTIGGETIPEKIDSYGTGLGNFGKNVMNMEPGISAGPNVQSSWFGEPSKTLSMGGSGLLGNAATSRYGVLPPVPQGSTEYFKALQSPAGGAAQFSNASPEAVTGLTTAKEAGAGSKGLMGTAGAALGAGLNIYDMTQQGVTAGNALGLGGSALLGLSNAWNPLGWAMLGTSAAGSLFDWW